MCKCAITMLTIHLAALRFFAYHGLYEEEKLLGTTFELDVTIVYQPVHFPPRDINDTLNYVSVYSLLKQVMQRRENLLETVLYNMAQALLHEFSTVQSVSLYLRKLQPPITDFEGSVGIHYSVDRKELPGA